MSTRLTLTLPPTLGSETVEVDAKRFSGERTPAKPTTANQSWLSGPVIAVGSAVIIILVTVIALLIGPNSNSPGGSKPVITKKTPPSNDDEDEGDRTSTPNVAASSPGIG